MKKRVRYSKITAVDGDTLRIMQCCGRIGVRAKGIDTHELNGRHSKKANEAKQLLQQFSKKFFKPRIYGHWIKGKGEFKGFDGWRLDAYGRIIGTIYVWRWRNFGYIHYDRFIKRRNLHKKGSKWNKVHV